ncbi:hypothetical protein GCM10022240_10840 [Microbacterium kribbense]|uniref:Uncharacterized protein n=1 Tax=Microbacterium kribbense TaxID=433645 RepID=A0ABP7GBR8_9MICO
MGYLVLVAWVIQASFGVTLLVSWARHARGQDGGLVLPHALMMVAFLAPWTAFVATGLSVWAWVGFGVLTAFIGFGDAAMVRRARALRGEGSRGLRDYFPAIGVATSGALGRRTNFHMWFSPVVWLGSLAVAIVATAAV